MLNIIEINKRRTAILSTLKNSPHTARLVEELAASHIEIFEQIVAFITKYAYSKADFAAELKNRINQECSCSDLGFVFEEIALCPTCTMKQKVE